MSKKPFSFDIDDASARELLGDRTPLLKPGTVGRVRLVRALQQNFGVGFRSLPGPKATLEDFDKQNDQAREDFELLEKLKQVRMDQEIQRNKFSQKVERDLDKREPLGPELLGDIE